MNQIKTKRAFILAYFVLVLAWGAGIGRSQTTDRLQQIDKRLAEKRAAAEAHNKQMESIRDPDKLATAMQRHFQMTEEIIGLMVERRQLASAQTQSSGAGAGSATGMQGGGMGGMMEHGGMEGEMGMMQKEMGGMHGEGGMGRGMMQNEMGGMSGQAGSSGKTRATAQSDEMKQMMQRIAEHSAYMETLKDRTQLSKEMLRHQRMLDQMLELMQ